MRMQRYVLRWGWGQSTASSGLPQMDRLHVLTSSYRGRDAHLVHDAPSEAAYQGVVLLQIVLHALYHVAHRAGSCWTGLQAHITPHQTFSWVPWMLYHLYSRYPVHGWKSMAGRSVLQ